MPDYKYDLDPSDIKLIAPLLPWLNGAMKYLGLTLDTSIDVNIIFYPYMDLNIREQCQNLDPSIIEFAHQIHTQVASRVWDGFRHDILTLDKIVASVQEKYPGFNLNSIKRA